MNEQVVDYYYKSLEKIVDSLSPEGVLEWPIAYYEKIIYNIYLYNLSIPTRRECFSMEPKVIELLNKELPGLNSTAISNRFIIEYITAKPPSGLRPMSFSVYDQIQALSSHILNFGLASDLIKYRLADIKLEILPSGRLVTDQENYDRMRDQHHESYSAGEEVRLRNSFGRYWSYGKENTKEQKYLDKIDKATQAEFGYPLNDLLNLIDEIHLSAKI